VSLYAESSAVLAWLLDEAASSQVRQVLAASEIIVSLDLTLIECDRVVLRAAALGELTQRLLIDERIWRRRPLTGTSSASVRRSLRARQPFPGEPIRALDAIHLASVLFARSAVVGLEVLSLGDRIRKAAGRLGLRVHPA
jgi:PIN domain